MNGIYILAGFFSRKISLLYALVILLFRLLAEQLFACRHSHVTLIKDYFFSECQNQ